MVLFISYSSRDQAALEKVRAALQRAHLQVWLDEELSGGEVWWNTILEEIRGCEVFIAALSKSYLESKPCQAELRYAQDLHRPILPVQIGPLDSMRVNPLAAVQAIDYQNPSIDTGIELVAAVHARKAKVEPLPSPLPDPPPVPFAYLLRLDTAIAAPELGPREQVQLLSELKEGLATDGDEPSARRDLTQLLIKLRERPDITWKTRTDVDAVLTSIQTKEPAPPPPSSLDSGPLPSSAGAGPPPSSGGFGAPPAFPPGPATGPQPVPMPPYGAPDTGAGKPRISRKRWIIAGGVGAAVAAAVAVIVLAIPNPRPPASPVAVAALDGLLLSPAEVNTALGATAMTVTQSLTTLWDDSAYVPDKACLPIFAVAEVPAYAGSGWTAVRDQAVQEPGGNATHQVLQAVVLFSSAHDADAFFTASTQSWSACSNRQFTVTQAGTPDAVWSVGPISTTNGTLSATRTGGNESCQRALTVANNVAIDVLVCSLNQSDSAVNIAHQIAAKVPTK